MKIKFVFLIILNLSPIFAMNDKIHERKNPLLFKTNDLVQFNCISANDIQDATCQIKDLTKQKIESIKSIPSSKRTFENTMKAYDLMYHQFSNVINTIYLLAYTHPDSAIRQQCLTSVDDLSKFDNEIQFNEDLYKATCAYARTKEAKQLKGYRKKFLDDRLKYYSLNGFNLPKNKREELKKLFDQITTIGIEFSMNIAGVKDYLELEENEMDGLPEDYKNSKRTEDGKYRIDLTYPSIVPFFQLANNENARKKLFILHLNRASDKNLDLLEKLISKRIEVAKILGFKTAASYMIIDNMAKNPENVWNFENTLLEKIKPKVKKDLEELIEIKRNHLKNPIINEINEWEFRYYTNKLLMEKYSIDNQKIKEYFEVNNVINGILTICKELYQVDFEEVKQAPVWHEDVRLYEMKCNNTVLARIYLDLYPRDDKYKHFACFGMYHGTQIGEEYQIPTAALVCNFPRPTIDFPGLLTHDDVVTFFHEFGHMMHFVMSRSELSGQSGISNTHEFVEVPSQFFENWAWNYESLKIFAKHYKTNETLPNDLFNKMLAARNVNSGINTNRQIFFGLLDLTYHDKFEPYQGKTTTDVLIDLQNRINVFKYTEGTHMQASFDHLVGYGAGYYGYMWSKVYAEDLFSEFEKDGILNPKTGERFKNEILSKGSTEDEWEMIKRFLNREPNQQAFIKSLGLDTNTLTN